MKTKLILAVALSAIYGAAFACDTPTHPKDCDGHGSGHKYHHPTKPTPTPAPNPVFTIQPVAGATANVAVDNKNTNVNTNTATSSSKSSSKSNSKSSSKSKSSVSGSGNSTVNITTPESQTIKYEGSYKVKNTPDISIGGPASGPCNGFSGGVGVSGPGFSLGGNTSTVDEGCTRRETIRVCAMVGRWDCVNALIDNDPLISKALEQAKNRQAGQPVANVAPAVTAAPANPLDNTYGPNVGYHINQ